MGSTQLFTGLLLAIGIIHLVFSAVDAVDQWLLKNRRVSGTAAAEKKQVSRSNWYVFFDAADLTGKQKPSGRKQTPRPSNSNRRQRPRPRMTAQF